MLGAIGSAIGGLLGQVGDTMNAPRKAIWGALGLPETGAELVSNALGTDRDSALTQALGFGAEVVGDPLTYMGGIFGKLGSKAGAALKGSGGVAPLLNARRQFGMVKDFLPEVAGSGRAVGRANPRFLTPELAERGMQQAAEGFQGGRSLGTFFPDQMFGVLPNGAAQHTARHELTHGLTGAARYHGGGEQMAALPRLASALYRGSDANTFRRGMAEIVDEMAAHAAQGRGLPAQAGHAFEFLMRGSPGYAASFAETSPLAAALYRSFPYAAAGGAAAGAGAAAYPLFSQ